MTGRDYEKGRTVIQIGSKIRQFISEFKYEIELEIFEFH